MLSKFSKNINGRDALEYVLNGNESDIAELSSDEDDENDEIQEHKIAEAPYHNEEDPHFENAEELNNDRDHEVPTKSMFIAGEKGAFQMLLVSLCSKKKLFPGCHHPLSIFKCFGLMNSASI